MGKLLEALKGEACPKKIRYDLPESVLVPIAGGVDGGLRIEVVAAIGKDHGIIEEVGTANSGVTRIRGLLVVDKEEGMHLIDEELSARPEKIGNFGEQAGQVWQSSKSPYGDVGKVEEVTVLWWDVVDTRPNNSDFELSSGGQSMCLLDESIGNVEPDATFCPRALDGDEFAGIVAG